MLSSGLGWTCATEEKSTLLYRQMYSGASLFSSLFGSDHTLSAVDCKRVREIRVLITIQGSWALFLAVNRCVNTKHLVFSVIRTGS